MHENNGNTTLKPKELIYDLFYKQSLIGFFLMECDEPISWKSDEFDEAVFNELFYYQKVTIANDVFLNQYGYTHNEVIGMSPADFFKHDIEHGSDTLRQILDRGHLTRITDERKADGSRIWIEGNYSMVYDDQNRIIGMFGIQSDVTERKLSEEALQKSESHFRNLFENATIGIYQAKLDGNLLVANPAFYKMLGYSSMDELFKAYKTEIFHVDPSLRENIIEIIKRDGKVTGFETKLYKKDQSIIFVRGNARAVKDSTGTIQYYEGTIEDITEKKSMIEALIESEKKLRDTNSTKDKFFSIIAHDLRSPFQGLLGIANILVEEELTINERMEFERKLLDGLKIQFNLLDNLLAWSRLQRGIMEYNPVSNNLMSDIEETIILLKESLNNKNHTLQIDVPKELTLLYDRKMITAVLRNLLSNAIKFTAKNGTISLKVCNSDNEVVCCVSDNGIGVSEDEMEKIFRIDSHFVKRGTNDEGGTGLGLSLCKDFIEKHKGKIWVESQVGKGSKFYFSLPYIR